MLFIIFSVMSSGTFGQQSNTLYFMKGVPQIYQVNPAFQPDCNFFLGLPGISPFQLRFENTPFALNDVVMYNESLDSLITFLHPLADKDAFLALLKDKNFINTEVSTSLGSMGFRANNAYISLDITTRATARVVYPDDLLKFPINGPDTDMEYDFNGLGIAATAWNEAAMGVSYSFSEKLNIGLRGKFIFGSGNIEIKKFDVTLSTNEDSWPVRSNILLNATTPFLDIALDEDGMLDFDNIKLKEFPKSLRSVLANPKNSGLAMDIGVDFKPLDWLQFSASIVDLGYISWKDNVYNLENNAEYVFEGIEVIIDSEDFMKDFLDTLKNNFKFSTTELAYKTRLPAKLYTGVSFYPHPKINFGLLSRMEFIEGIIRQQFTMSANFYPLRMLSAAFSYSVIDGYYKNLGFGLSLKPGPFNFYIITDTGISSALWPYEARSVNIRTGLNLAFGCRKIKKEPKYDIPFSP